MCNLFDQSLSLDELLDLYEIQEVGDHEISLQPGRYPQYDAAIVTSADRRDIEMARWGIIAHWNKTEPPKAKQWNNARSETAHQLGSFRFALEHHRCVFPASRFAEWEGVPGKKTNVWFGAADGSVLSIAGIASRWKTPDDTWVQTATMMTSAPNAWFTPWHTRQLVFLENDEEVNMWLDNDRYDLELLQELMAPASEDYLKVVERDPSRT